MHQALKDQKRKYAAAKEGWRDQSRKRNRLRKIRRPAAESARPNTHQQPPIDRRTPRLTISSVTLAQLGITTDCTTRLAPSEKHRRARPAKLAPDGRDVPAEGLEVTEEGQENGEEVVRNGTVGGEEAAIRPTRLSLDEALISPLELVPVFTLYPEARLPRTNAVMPTLEEEEDQHASSLRLTRPDVEEALISPLALLSVPEDRRPRGNEVIATVVEEVEEKHTSPPPNISIPSRSQPKSQTAQTSPTSPTASAPSPTCSVPIPNTTIASGAKVHSWLLLTSSQSAGDNGEWAKLPPTRPYDVWHAEDLACGESAVEMMRRRQSSYAQDLLKGNLKVVNGHASP